MLNNSFERGETNLTLTVPKASRATQCNYGNWHYVPSTGKEEPLTPFFPMKVTDV